MTSLFSNLCPSCERAPVFGGFLSMNRACPSCGTVFEKESGYFIGAMIASYFLGVFLAFPVLIALIFFARAGIALSIGATAALILVLQPLLFRYSRLLWIHIEHRLTKAIHQNQKRPPDS